MIDKIILKISERKIELTEDEARQVWADLNPRFGQPAYIPTYPIYPTYPTSPPWITYPYLYSSGIGTINCGSTEITSGITTTNADVPFTYTS